MESTDETTAPVYMIDTAGCDCHEDDTPEGGVTRGGGTGARGGVTRGGSELLAASRSNAAEAALVAEHVRLFIVCLTFRSYFSFFYSLSRCLQVKRLIDAGVTADQIGVITPYNAQVIRRDRAEIAPRSRRDRAEIGSVCPGG